MSNSIYERRSIRKYLDKRVEKELIEQIIDAGRMAPSAKNRQPWKFKILSASDKNAVADILEDKTRDIPGHTGPHTAGVIRNVPHLIMVFIDNTVVENRDMDIISIGACIENMILAYTDMGLGTIWIGNTNLISNEIKEILNVPYETVSCVGVGYQDQFPKARPRKEISDVIL